jgi:Holliday junction DNA helicase RuvA
MLGFAPVPSKKVVMKILEQDPQTPVETIVKLALRML